MHLLSVSEAAAAGRADRQAGASPVRRVDGGRHRPAVRSDGFSNRELHLLTAGGTHSNARDLHRFSGDEFPSEEAAARWRQRHPFDEARIRQQLAGDVRPFVRVTWQPAGQGHKSRASIIPAADAAAFRARAERAFPVLLNWSVEPFTPGAKQSGEDMDIRFGTIQSGISDCSPEAEGAPWSVTPHEAEAGEHPPDG